MKADSQRAKTDGHLDRVEDPEAHTPLGIYIEKRSIMNLVSYLYFYQVNLVEYWANQLQILAFTVSVKVSTRNVG